MPPVAEPLSFKKTSLPPRELSPPVVRHPALLPLEQGDHLSRDEFERRYLAMPQIQKAELIEGVVHMASPVRWDKHGHQHARLIHWLVCYEDESPGVQTGDNSTVRLDLDNEPQPDATLIVEPRCGGQVLIDADGYVAGAPELVAEVSASSASFDLHKKLRVYRRAGVREYLVWRVFDEAVDWFVLRGSEYQSLSTNSEGILKSEVFPGLWLARDALVKHEYRQVAAVLQQGLQSADHAAFVARLQPTTAPQ